VSTGGVFIGALMGMKTYVARKFWDSAGRIIAENVAGAGERDWHMFRLKNGLILQYL
jgi:hypothetical protein